MSAHTPGPWTLQPIGDETECNILGAGHELVATVSDNDARLIAAAPMMRQTLQAIVSMKVDEKTDHAQLVALIQAMAATVLESK